jgi:signal transduction histidine kinase/DNA-binding response OmpR family regulator
MRIRLHRRQKARAPPDFLAGGGKLGALMRSHDWTQSPLGTPESWPDALKMSVSICLNSRFPMVLWWGPEFATLYNDAYRPMLGATKHPGGLGRPGIESWREIWDIIGVQLRGVRETGQASWSEDLLLVVERYGYREEAYFTYSYSPIKNADGTIGGVFTAVNETTARVLGERRLRTLRELAECTTDGKSVEGACEILAGVLGKGNPDVPLAGLYLASDDGLTARRLATSGFGVEVAPAVIQLDTDDPWHVGEVIRTGCAVLVDDLGKHFRDLPGGEWPEPTTSALVLPVMKAGQQPGTTGVLIAGINKRRELDDEYRGFLELVAGHMATAVTNARAHEEERRRAEALEEINRAKTVFFSNVSHEFRTPLTLMIGPIEEVLAKPEDQVFPATRALIETAHRSGLRLLKLVNALLDFSRIEAGRMQASYEPLDLAAWTAELASNFRSATQKAGLLLVVDCPPLSEPVFVDREMWEKIVLNLVSNAFKFTFEGEIVVSLRPTSIGRFAELTVRDTGTGIPEHELPRLFERFHRVEGARGRSFEGSGIGLALVQELVKLHGGSMGVESKVGRGSTFTVSIPFGTAHLPAERIGERRGPVSTALRRQAFVEEALQWLPEQGTGLDLAILQQAQPETLAIPADSFGPPPRILVADDNADMCKYVRRLLAGRFEVEAVPDGEAALEAAQAKPPALVLSDVMMPRLDGFGLVKAIRADQRLREVPVILLSARAGEEAKVEGLDAGADDYLVKPFSARELVARVQANLQMSQIRKEAEEKLRKRTTELETVLETVPTAVWFTYDRDARHVTGNRHAADLLRLPAHANASLTASENERPSYRLFREGQEVPPGDLPIQRAARGEKVDNEELELHFPDGDRKTLLVRAAPLHGTAGEIHGAVAAAVDITDRKRHADRQQLLLNEINHRVKNTLATVQSIAVQTLRNAENTVQARRHFEGRLMALSRVHNILTRENWEGASLRNMIADSIAPYRDQERERFETEGPEVSIPAKYALALAMALHELCTNAVKYGALSTENGHVRIAWNVSARNGSRQLTIRWREVGGPPVRPPSRRGFGSRLIELGLKQDLGGHVQIDFASTGVSCTIEAPLPPRAGGDTSTLGDEATNE